MQIHQGTREAIHARNNELIPLTQIPQNLLQLGTVTSRATDLLFVNLRRPRRTELGKLAIQVLLQRTHAGVTDFLPHNNVLMFVQL
ncbi:hypothetical protein CUREI_11010 [Corynebacterium ureicelerivorans]|uniref:Uncharacterized protein n=1 Tax=Corynebacterium ureicelerivorans TaxID=401472 RepID=A0A077HMZ6_9CORY|nr:hypothetical protein CUREI_11010 [Corynebacterium ureicelerivorans]